jgi:hypothetical protein
MKLIYSIFSFYVKSSIHVALAVVFLTKITSELINLNLNKVLLIFIFCCVLVAYNFIKFFLNINEDDYIKNHKSIEIISITFIFFIIGFFSFFYLNLNSKITALLVFFLVILYSIPLFGFSNNLRNLSGIKIYIVSLSWTIVSVFLPYFNSHYFQLNHLLLIFYVQYTFVFVSTLPFEIRDCKLDPPSLLTLPQQIGINKTKSLGVILLMISFIVLLILHSNIQFLYSTFITQLVLVFLLVNSSINQNKYYASFIVESIPIIWWLLIKLFVLLIP